MPCQQLVADALFDEDAAGVLIDDGLFILLATLVDQILVDEEEDSYVNDSILNFLRLTRFRRITFRLDPLQLLLITLDPLLELRNIVLAKSISAVEHIPHTGETISHGLEIFK